MQKLGPERVYICLEAVFSTEREMQVADKLISGGIQVPISPSYSPCDLRQWFHGFMSQKLSSHLSMEDNVLGAQGHRENPVTSCLQKCCVSTQVCV